MLSLIFMAGSISVVLSVGINDCDGKTDNSPFFQGCNECWCRNGKATCTNKGCTFVSEYNDDDNNNDNANEVRRENAIGIHAWDLDNKFPKKEEVKRIPVTPYPPSFHYRFNLQQPILEKELQKYPPVLAYRHPDEGGLNVVKDVEVAQYGGQYPKYQQYPSFPQYQGYPNYKSYPAGVLPYQQYQVIPNPSPVNMQFPAARHMRQPKRDAIQFGRTRQSEETGDKSKSELNTL